MERVYGCCCGADVHKMPSGLQICCSMDCLRQVIFQTGSRGNSGNFLDTGKVLCRKRTGK